jgi:hypothetical protein
MTNYEEAWETMSGKYDNIKRMNKDLKQRLAMAQDEIAGLYEDIDKMDRGDTARRGRRAPKNYDSWDNANHSSVDAVCDETFLQHKFLKREAFIKYTPTDPKSLCGRIRKVLVYERGSVRKWSQRVWTMRAVPMIIERFKVLRSNYNTAVRDAFRG